MAEALGGSKVQVVYMTWAVALQGSRVCGSQGMQISDYISTLAGIKNELGQIRSRGSTHGARHHAILTGSWVSSLGKYLIKVCVDFRGGLDTDNM